MTRFEGPHIFLFGAFAMVTLAACGERVHSIHVSPPEMVFGQEGASMEIEVEARDRRGAKLGTAPITFRSRDTAVASVDSMGTVTAVGHGTATVDVVVEGTEVMDFVHVAVRLPDRIELRPASTTCYIGGIKNITAQVFDRSGKVIPNVPIEWASSDESKARVEGGEVTGIDEGEAVVTAKALGLEAVSNISVSWAPGQKALLDAEARSTKRGRGGNRGGGGEKGPAWDPRLSVFDD